MSCFGLTLFMYISMKVANLPMVPVVVSWDRMPLNALTVLVRAHTLAWSKTFFPTKV